MWLTGVTNAINKLFRFHMTHVDKTTDRKNVILKCAWGMCLIYLCVCIIHSLLIMIWSNKCFIKIWRDLFNMCVTYLRSKKSSWRIVAMCYTFLGLLYVYSIFTLNFGLFVMWSFLLVSFFIWLILRFFLLFFSFNKLKCCIYFRWNNFVLNPKWCIFEMCWTF